MIPQAQTPGSSRVGRGGISELQPPAGGAEARPRCLCRRGGCPRSEGHPGASVCPSRVPTRGPPVTCPTATRLWERVLCLVAPRCPLPTALACARGAQPCAETDPLAPPPGSGLLHSSQEPTRGGSDTGEPRVGPGKAGRPQQLRTEGSGSAAPWCVPCSPGRGPVDRKTSSGFQGSPCCRPQSDDQTTPRSWLWVTLASRLVVKNRNRV